MTEEAEKKCAICGKPQQAKFKPFCSKRCSMIDLGRWLGEGYKIAANDDQEEEADIPKEKGSKSRDDTDIE